jgi:hypothetical protein
MGTLVVVVGVGVAAAAYYLFATWLTTSDAARRARVQALGPLMELATDPRSEARLDASSSGDRAAADTHGGDCCRPPTPEEK